MSETRDNVRGNRVRAWSVTITNDGVSSHVVVGALSEVSAKRYAHDHIKPPAAYSRTYKVIRLDAWVRDVGVQPPWKEE